MTIEVDPSPRIRIQTVHALPASYWTTQLLLAESATVADALESARSAIHAAGIALDMAGLAVFGKTVEPRTRLRDGDRIELLRPLLVSPRDARTSRASATRKR